MLRALAAGKKKKIFFLLVLWEEIFVCIEVWGLNTEISWVLKEIVIFFVCS
jgi:hypothetical protein